MNKILLPLGILLCCIVTPVQAAGLTREAAFVYLWDTIYRPVYNTYEAPFDDVFEDRSSYKVLTWAKRRGVLDDERKFYPDVAVQPEDLVLWLLRTRNVDTIDVLTIENLPNFTAKYPVLQQFLNNKRDITQESLENLVRNFTKELNSEIHEISYYSEKFHGKGTAFGETFDMNALTAAHPSFPHNTLVRVTNTENDQSVIVRVNDRGPFVPNRSMDLSLAGFESLTERTSGVLYAVTIERLGDVELYPLAPDDSFIEKNVSPDVVTPEVTPVATLVGTKAAIDAPTCNRFAHYYQKRLTPDVRFLRGVPHILPLGSSLTLRANDFFVVRSITQANQVMPIQQWIMPQKEVFTYTPEQVGTYLITIGNSTGTKRTFTMNVEECS